MSDMSALSDRLMMNIELQWRWTVSAENHLLSWEMEVLDTHFRLLLRFREVRKNGKRVR